MFSKKETFKIPAQIRKKFFTYANECGEKKALNQDAWVNAIGKLNEQNDKDFINFIHECITDAKKYIEEGNKEQISRNAYFLGVLNRTGCIGFKDVQLAKECFEKSTAAVPNPASLFNLAEMLRHGEGGKEDRVEAFKLYQQAADLNEPRSITLLARYYYEGWEPVIKDVPQAEELFQQAANLGDYRAMYYLALAKEGANDHIEALMLLNKAIILNTEYDEKIRKEFNHVRDQILSLGVTDCGTSLKQIVNKLWDDILNPSIVLSDEMQLFLGTTCERFLQQKWQESISKIKHANNFKQLNSQVQSLKRNNALCQVLTGDLKSFIEAFDEQQTNIHIFSNQSKKKWHLPGKLSYSTATLFFNKEFIENRIHVPGRLIKKEQHNHANNHCCFTGLPGRK